MSRAEQYGRGKKRDTLSFQLTRTRLQVLESDNPQETLREYRSLVKKQSSGPADTYGLALASWRSGAKDAAGKQLGGLMKDDPDRVLYRITMAQLLMDNGQAQEALRLYKDTLSLYPGDLTVSQYYVAALIEAGKAGKARDQVLKMLRHKQARTAPIYELWAKATSISGPAWETNVASAEVYFLYGNLRFAIDQLQQALDHRGLSEYDTARIRARLQEFKQLTAAREHK